MPVVPHRLAAAATERLPARLVTSFPFSCRPVLLKSLALFGLDLPMNSGEKFVAWQRARLHLIVSQIAPTVLLISTVALLQWGLADTGLAIRLSALGILLASGILGALVQFQSASEAQAIAKDLVGGEFDQVVRASADWLWVPKFVTPAIFVGIYVALVIALLA